MVILIQGFFFQQNFELMVSQASHEGASGPFLMVSENLINYMYAGIIFPGQKEVLTGYVQDHFGLASLSDIQRSEEKLCFTKRYQNPARSDTIRYTFNKRDGESWIGLYEGRETGTGVTRCFLREMSDDFVSVEPLITLLDRKAAWSWSA